MNHPIYLDNNSTTPVDALVLEAMLPYFTRCFGNPSNGMHRLGEEAARAIDQARERVASLIGARAREIVFTSGATESNNLAIFGVARRHRHRGDHLVTAAIEHKAVLYPMHQLEREGFRVTVLPVGPDGRVDPAAVADAITDRTLLVSVMAANNEIGTLQPIAQIGEICQERGVLFHSDAVQALGKIPFDVDEAGVDLLSISAHKMYGPKGAGALYVRGGEGRLPLEPLVFGGGQEKGLRSGTQAVPNIVGLGAACELAERYLNEEPKGLRNLRDLFASLLAARIPGIHVHGNPIECLPGLLNVGFPSVDGDALITALHDVAASQGSSCTSGAFEPSHVLRAIGVSDEVAKASIRFGVGRFTTEEEVRAATEHIVRTYDTLRRVCSVNRVVDVDQVGG
jgi:cysteine desulfurase